MATKVAYRYMLDGAGPYESAQYDSQEDADKAASENGHKAESYHLYDDKGAPLTTQVREQINLDQNGQYSQPPASQDFTNGSQPA